MQLNFKFSVETNHTIKLSLKRKQILWFNLWLLSWRLHKKQKQLVINIWTVKLE